MKSILIQACNIAYDAKWQQKSLFLVAHLNIENWFRINILIVSKFEFITANKIKNKSNQKESLRGYTSII